MKKYIDEYGNTHYIKSELGRGGQGVVYSTKDGDVVIKEAFKNNKLITDEKEIKHFHNKVKSIKFKPIPFDIEIARPIALLKNKAGYVMKMLDNMNPLTNLFPNLVSIKELENIKIPDFLKNLNDERLQKIFSYYFNTGSLRKRLEVLLKIAITLYRLHLRGLVYFDISYNNIFYNDDVAYFIDIDNLKYNSSIKRKDSIQTEDFEVPEVANGIEPNSFYSDIYSFGILAYYLLTIQHPFKGNALENISNESWDEEENDEWENSINIWDLPWIEDSNDDSNRSKGGLRGRLTISEELNELFHILFEKGKINKYKRPALNLWIKALSNALYQTIECLNCKATYYDKYFGKCPYCKNNKPSRIVINSYIFKDGKKLEKGSKYFVRELSDEIRLPEYLFKEFGLDIFARVKFFNKRVEFYFESDKEEIYFNKDRKIYRLRQKIGIDKLEKGIYLIVKSDIERYLDIRLIK